jgi:nucleoside-diphosphate-sugar epimerase
MRVLVTGASGFVGGALVKTLLDRGHEVSTASRGETLDGAIVDRVAAAHKTDLAAPIKWGPMLTGVDAVVHLAGIAHIGTDICETIYDRVNHRATAELAVAARQAEVKRLVFMSSVRAQSGAAASHVLTETDLPRPTDAYGRSKLAAEQAIRESGVRFTILRPVLIYGPGVKGNLATLLRLAAMPVPLPFGAFRNKRSLLHRDALISAIEYILAETASEGETYLVADPESLTPADIVAAMRRGLGRSPDLLSVSPALIRLGLRMLGRAALWNSLGGDLVVDTGKLARAGWRSPYDPRTALADVTRDEHLE